MSRVQILLSDLIQHDFDLTHIEDVSWLESIEDQELESLVVALAEMGPSAPTHALSRLFHRLLTRQRHEAMSSLSANSIQALAQLYTSRTNTCSARHLILAILNSDGSADAVHESVELLVADPLQTCNDVAVALAPFFHRLHSFASDEVFPRLFDAADNLAAAPPIFDLANFMYREDLIEPHPAAERIESLVPFFGGLIQRLGVLQEGNQPANAEESQHYRTQVQESVSLAVSLCDTFAQLECEDAIGKLYQALELQHRRLQTEAAAALAQLGEEAGVDHLIGLAAEPIARLRVLQYCDELGITDQIPDEHCTGAARAESELALWLAQPAQFGLPPLKCELLDERELYWPGYEDLVSCFLFRYEYAFQEGTYSNIGIAGPLTRSLATDLSDLPIEDIYSVFAGYDAEHEEMVEYEIHQLSELQLADVSRLERRIRDHGYYAIQPQRFGTFFGERYLVAEAELDGAKGLVVADTNELMQCRIPSTNEAAFLYRGRKLIRTFNTDS